MSHGRGVCGSRAKCSGQLAADGLRECRVRSHRGKSAAQRHILVAQGEIEALVNAMSAQNGVLTESSARSETGSRRLASAVGRIRVEH